uniref:Uncharacterized protein n=1 Tax=Romanomermis culicivorax TaxID=13658 RepID=A0A915JSY0_ROMCU
MFGEHSVEQAVRRACSAREYLLVEQNHEHKKFARRACSRWDNLSKVKKCAHDQCQIMGALIGRNGRQKTSRRRRPATH